MTERCLAKSPAQARPPVFVRVPFADWLRLLDSVGVTPHLAPDDVITAAVRRIEGLRNALAEADARARQGAQLK